MIHRFFKGVRTRTVLYAGLLVLVVGISALCVWGPGLYHTARIEYAARTIMVACASHAHRPSCYDREIPKVMDKGFTMEEAFLVQSRVAHHDASYMYCHVLGHALSAREVAKDPDSWKEVIPRCPPGQCANGCLHGAAQERYKRDVIGIDLLLGQVPDFARVCMSSPERTYTGLERTLCYHGIGHVGMYATGGVVHDALRFCNALNTAVDNLSGGVAAWRPCYEGVFMAVFQFQDEDDRALVTKFAPTTEVQAERYCDTFTGRARAACVRESWPLHMDAIQKPARMVALCARVPGLEYEQDCYNTLISIMATAADFDQEAIESFCTQLPGNRKGQCFAHAASREVDTDYRLAPRAVALCERAAAFGFGDRCFMELLYYSHFNYIPQSSAFTAFCTTLPQSWRQRCLSDEGAHIKSDIYDV